MPPEMDRVKIRSRGLAWAEDAGRMSVIMENRVMKIFDFVILIGNIITTTAQILMLMREIRMHSCGFHSLNCRFDR